jgi:predicted ArsR family transcriptional regulator
MRETMKKRTLRFIASHGPMGVTADEIVWAAGLMHNNVAPRMTDLKANGLITEAGARPTRQGRKAKAWKICDDQSYQ